MATDATQNTVGAVETALEIIEAVRTLDHPGVSDVAEHLDRPISTTYNHLNTLEQNEYLAKDGTAYHLGFRLLELGGERRQGEDVYKHAIDEIDNLADETGDLVNLVVEEHGWGVHLYLSRGGKAVQLDSFPGMRSYLHTTASGKSMLAHLPNDHIRAILDRHGLVKRTEQTIIDRETLYEELTDIRKRGYAFDDGERLEGLRCVGAPIITLDGRILGAVSVSGPTSRLNGNRFEEELPRKVRSTADVIGINTAYV